MKRINIFYVATVLLGLACFYLLNSLQSSPSLSFYGFAESDETEINYNYPVLVEKILVGSGQEVIKGDTLLHLVRKKVKERIDDYDFKINQLKSEQKEWRKRQELEISELVNEKKSRVNLLLIQLEKTQSELDYKKELSNGLENITQTKQSYAPITQKIKAIQTEITQVKAAIDLRINNIKQLIIQRSTPGQNRINQIELERVFDESQRLISIPVLAPDDGIIGNISCKVDEHIPSYNTLLTFYEPHSKYVRGYVHEDMTLQVELGNYFDVSSLKDPTIKYQGEVTGLGSRIIEIPSRLRKNPEFKTYGREVIVRIEDNSSFLQKEKVSLSHKNSL